MSPSQFLYVTCQLGAEPALKKEIARDYPSLRFAFSRPGFVTFKWVGDAASFGADFELQAVFARTWGLSLGKITGSGEELARQAVEKAAGLQPGNGRIRLHVWERDRHKPGEEPLGFHSGEWALGARQLILREAAERFQEEPMALAGETVFDVIVVEEDEWWLGSHPQSGGRLPFPGAKPDLSLPADAPSRAFLKIEEGLLWSGAPLRAGDQALEVGSAPGGASYALLKRGIKVIGIDPAEMDRRVLAHPGFVHIPEQVNAVLRESLPEKVDWFLLDMNVPPSVSLFAADRLVHRLRNSLLGVFLTIKLNEWKIADEIPGMLEHIRAMGMVRTRAIQLPSNRQEIFVYGVTRKGLSRLSSA